MSASGAANESDDSSSTPPQVSEPPLPASSSVFGSTAPIRTLNEPPTFRGSEPTTPSATQDPMTPTLDRIGWLFPVHLARFGWEKFGEDARSTLRIVVWLALLVLIISVVLSHSETAYKAVIGWKTGPEWQVFLQDFVTSPAAAGAAALLAAIIAARSFARGLNHTKEEARANRIKEAAESWWEQFEWVTDRIVPKDPKQERLHNGLATSLLGALEATAGGMFQREAVDGIRHTYIRGTAIPLSKATLGELMAQLREVRTFADASWISGDPALQAHVRAYVYLLETLVALRTAWKTEDIVIEPAEQYPWKSRSKVHALVRIHRQWAVVNATSRPARSIDMRDITSLDRVTEHMKELEADFLVVVALNPLQNGTWQETRSQDPRVRLIHWDPKEDPSELRKRIELHIGPDNPASSLPGNEELEGSAQ